MRTAFFYNNHIKYQALTSSPFSSKLVAVAIMAVLLTLCYGETAFAVDDGSPLAQPFVIQGQLEIRFTDEVTVNSAVRSFGRVSVSSPAVDAVLSTYAVSEMYSVFPWRDETSTNAAERRMSKYELLVFPVTVDLDIMIDELLATGKVATAEKIWAVPVMELQGSSAFGSQATPNDPSWNLQYAPALIGATSVWDVENGSDTAKIGVTDTGVNYLHEDLKNQIWVNPGEDIDNDGEVYDLDDLNGIDDDGNGIVDDLIGYDFFTGFGLPLFPGEEGGGPDSDPNDFNGHGTHVAGIAAAVSNNATGVAGIAGGWGGSQSYSSRGARIMCLRIGGTADDGNGYVNLSNAASAFDYAARMGADVMNASWGSSGLSSMLDAINMAADSGISIGKAAGNANNSEGDWMNLLPGVISVASVNSSDIRSGFSSFGDWVEISAPGSSIYATYSSQYTPTYRYLSGTSMATPAYCGAFLLVKSLMPSFTRVEIDSLLLATADNIDAQNPTYVGALGSGRVNVASAIADLPVANFSAGPVLSGTLGLTVDFVDLSPNSPSSWLWSFGDGANSTMQNPSHTYSQPGLFTVTLEATEPRGVGFEQAKRMVFIHADTVGGDSGSGLLSEGVTVPIALHNDFLVKSIILPLSYADFNGISLVFDSFSTVGLQTQDWDVQSLGLNDPVGKELLITLQSDLIAGHSRYLQPGDGPIVNLHFSFDPSSDPGALPITTTTVLGDVLLVETQQGSYTPSSTPSLAIMAGCCEQAGDADNSGSTNIADVTFLITRIFSSGPAPVCADAADADGSNSVNISDVTYLIARIFSSGPAPVCGSTGL